MNLLPFVMIIIMILGLFSISQFQGAITQKKEHQLYLAYFHGLRETRNEKEKTAYKRSKIKKKPEPTQTNDTRPKSARYFRIKHEGWEKGRLNLSTLLKKPHKYEGLESLAESYVKQLYGHASFYPQDENFPKTLITALVEIYAGNKNPPELYEIAFKDKTLNDIFFKMVHGTHTYDLEKKIGYPPFGEMFTFEESARPPMNFHYANLPFLSTILGEKVKDKLVKLEIELLPDARKKCLSPLKKQDVEDLLMGKTLGKSGTVLGLFDFKYETSKRDPQHYIDPATAITVKIH